MNYSCAGALNSDLAAIIAEGNPVQLGTDKVLCAMLCIATPVAVRMKAASDKNNG